MTQRQMNKIISLTYHEITEDPRVLKQARVLRKAGYDVSVFCDWPDELPQHDEIDGIQITRFRCFSPDGVSTDFFDDLTFLDQSRGELAKRYLPYAQSCEYIKQVDRFLEGLLGPDAMRRSHSTYFKEKSGWERKRRLFEYLWLNVRLQFIRIPIPPSAIMSTEQNFVKRSRRLQERDRYYKTEHRRYRQQLFQAESLVFASNFPDIELEDKIAAVHAHDIYCLPTGVMLAQKLGVPLVYDAHEYEPARASKMDPYGSNLPELIENDCFPYITHLITVSEGIGDLYAKRFQGPRPTIVMNAPEVDISDLSSGIMFREGLQTVREKAGLSENVPLVVFTGGIQRTQRGMDKVLEALLYLPEAHLVALGPRKARNDEWLLNVAREVGVENRVHLLPPVDARDVPAVISTATVSVVPIQDASLSYRYCLPNKLFEAAFAQIPICVSDLPEMRRFIEATGIGRTMDQTDPKDIAAALKDVIENHSCYSMSQEAKERLASEYSWHRQAEKLCHLYSKMLGPSG
ncbi:MAG: glycosyltransferase family 4 protein [Rhodobacteraceae bacterium]|nr:glycosyltransferase family 4 protein [Paracoccaceae bacterium]